MIYVYRDRAGDEQEIEMPLGEAPPSIVDSAGVEWKRKYTAPGISFKGEGWACKS